MNKPKCEFFSSRDFLTFSEGPLTNSHPAWIAHQANHILSERATVVDAVKTSTGHWYASEGGAMAKTHTALLIDVRPIERDTAESLWRELIKQTEKSNFAGATTERFIERAKRLLEGK